MSLSDASLRKLTAHLEQTGSPEGFVPVKRKRNDNAEWRLQSACFKWWRSAAAGLGVDARLLFSIPNGSVLGATYETRVIRAKMLKLAGMTPGIPDALLAVPRTDYTRVSEDIARKMPSYNLATVTHGLFIEFKAGSNGALSDEQLAVHPILLSAGYRVEVIRTFEDAVRTITSYVKSQ